jgi:thimet oligopeptidase
LPQIKPTGFREYDARWVFGPDINALGIQALGAGLGTLIHELGKTPKIVVGHDFRSYSIAIKQALTVGLMSAGIEVHDIGLALSPVAYFAQFHLDMHPREGKYQHAAAFGTRAGITDRQLPLTTLVCNFPGENDPSELMEFDQVSTFLHEFGHLIHGLFAGNHRWDSLSGIATEWDFVEAPSQMLEEWIYDLETLQGFATNATGEPIPAELVEKLNRARWFGEGLTAGIQMYYASLSLNYHSADPATFKLLPKMLDLEQRYSPLPHQQDTYFFTNLGHLNGYSAIYYTYMWSKVIAADLLTEFKKEGMHNANTALRYRQTILSQGGAKPAAVLVADFLGRPYNFDAFADDLKKGVGGK